MDQLFKSKSQFNSYLLKNKIKRVKKMLQSFSMANIPQNQQMKLNCERCRQRPNDLFLILLCNHLICQQCLDQSNEIEQKVYSGIRCSCGVITYQVSAQNQRISDGEQSDNGCKSYNILQNYQEAQSSPRLTHHKQKNSPHITANIHSNSKKQKQLRNQCLNNSIGFIQSKNTTSTKNISRINMQSFGSSNNYFANSQNQGSYQFERKGNDKQSYLLQKSKYYPNDRVKNLNKCKIQQEIKMFKTDLKKDNRKKQSTQKLKRQMILNHFQPKLIDSQSFDADFQNSEKENYPRNTTKITNSTHSQKQKLIRQASGQMIEKRKSPSRFSKQLQSQLNFIKVIFRKNLESLDRQFQQAKEKIQEDYSRLENSLKNLCLEALVLNHKQSRINMGKILSSKYNSYIGKRVEKLIEDIGKSFQHDSLNLAQIQLQEAKTMKSESLKKLREGYYQQEYLPTEYVYTNKPKIAYAKQKNYYLTPNVNQGQQKCKLHKKRNLRTNVIIEHSYN